MGKVPAEIQAIVDVKFMPGGMILIETDVREIEISLLPAQQKLIKALSLISPEAFKHLVEACFVEGYCLGSTDGVLRERNRMRRTVHQSGGT